jgi:branched-chain amino acid transport system ATP-binding protein
MLLEVEGLSVSYGTAQVVGGVDLAVEEGELVTLLGPNGAGKTTTLRAIAGLVRWEQQTYRGTKKGDITVSGQVRFDGQRLDGVAAHRIVAAGFVLCPERRRPFADLSVLDNLTAGAYLIRDRNQVKERLRAVYDLFPVLEERTGQRAATLSGGQQQMLAVGRALMARPKLLAIDEPSLGLAPQTKRDLVERIRQINQTGVAVLLVEQDASLALSLANRAYVLSQGHVVTSGAAQELMQDETLRRSYFGL